MSRYIADCSNDSVRQLADGIVSTLAGGGGACGGGVSGDGDDDRDGLGAAATIRTPTGLHLSEARGLLYVTTGHPSHRVRAIVVHSAAQRRAARAWHLVRIWSLVQRGRAHPQAARSPAVGGALRRGLFDKAQGERGSDVDVHHAGALRLLTRTPVVGVLARVLWYITGDKYRLMSSERAEV